jgi:hypothetical protein
LVAAVLAVGVGVATALLGPWEYRGRAVFVVASAAGDPAAAVPYRVELIKHAWTSVPAIESSPSSRWDVSADVQAGTLCLELTGPDRRAGQQALARMAGGYLDHVRAVAGQARSQASEGELLLGDLLEDLRSGVSEARRREQDVRTALPPGDVELRRDLAAERLQEQRHAYFADRDLLRTAQERLARLEATPVPDHPPIDPDMAERAMGANVPLQQDLAEFKVQLVVVRAHLLNVWQSSATALERLVAVVGELERSLRAGSGDRSVGPHRAALERATEAVEEFRARLRTFSQGWTQEFGALSRESTVAPRSARILDTQERLAELFADFSYRASGNLRAIRDQARALDAESDEQARRHVLTAKLTRGLHALEAAHRQFAFTASQVRTADHFRLAAAAKAGRGLHRRILFLQQELKLQLEQITRKQLEQVREQEMNELRGRIARLTVVTDAGLDTMLAYQDDYDAAAALAGESAAGRATAAAIGERIDEYNADIRDAQARLETMAAGRRSAVRPDAVRLVSCGVQAIPSNLGLRLAYAWAATVTTLLIVLGIRGVARRR